MLENLEKKNVSSPGHEENLPEEPVQREARQDELDSASIPSVSNSMASNLAGPGCVNGQLARPTPPSDDSPSTACQASTACAPGRVALGKAPPGFSSPPGIVPSRRIPPPPPPPAPIQHSSAAVNPATRPMQWTLLHTRPKTSGGGGSPDGSGGGGTGSGAGDPSNPHGNAHPGSWEEEEQVPIAPEEETHQKEDPPQAVAVRFQEQEVQARSTPPTTPPTAPPSGRAVDPWASLDRSRKPLPKL